MQLETPRRDRQSVSSLLAGRDDNDVVGEVILFKAGLHDRFGCPVTVVARKALNFLDTAGLEVILDLLGKALADERRLCDLAAPCRGQKFFDFR